MNQFELVIERGVKMESIEQWVFLVSILLMIVIALKLGYETGKDDGYHLALDDLEKTSHHIRYEREQWKD